MSGYSTVRYELDDTIATVTLNRPDKYNAINGEMSGPRVSRRQGDLHVYAW